MKPLRRMLTAALLAVAMVAQGAQFASFDEVKGQAVGIFGLSTILAQDDILYARDSKGKLKKIKTRKELPSVLESYDAPRLWDAKGVVTQGKQQYLQLTGTDGADVYLLICDLSRKNVLPRIVGPAKNNALIDRYRTERAYVLNPDQKAWANDYRRKYLPVEWLPTTLSNDLTNPFIWNIRVAGRKYSGPLTELSARFDFVPKSVVDTFLEIEEEKENAAHDAERDNQPIPCMILNAAKGTYNTAYAYNYDPTTGLVDVVTDGQTKKFKPAELRFINSDDLQFLKRRGITGVTVRQEVARKNDDVSRSDFEGYRAQMRKKEIDNIARSGALDADKIFILDFTPVEGKHGITSADIRFYNCFDREITSITFSLAGFSSDRGSRELNDSPTAEHSFILTGRYAPGAIDTCEVKQVGSRNSVIRVLYLTNVAIEFADGTSVEYSGMEEVGKHTYRERLERDPNDHFAPNMVPNSAL